MFLSRRAEAGSAAQGGVPAKSRRLRNVSFSTIIILLLTAVAAVAYSLGGIPLPQATDTSALPPHVVTVVIPDGVGSDPRLNFEPSSVLLVIGVNNTVVWSDMDASSRVSVSYVSVPPGAVQFDSGTLVLGENYTLTLTVPGLYRYQCTFHPGWMSGTIEVKPGV